MDKKAKAPEGGSPNPAFQPSPRKRRWLKKVERLRVVKPKGHVFYGTVRHPESQVTTRAVPIPEAKAIARDTTRQLHNGGAASVFLGVELICYYEKVGGAVQYRKPPKAES